MRVRADANPGAGDHAAARALDPCNRPRRGSPRCAPA